MFRTGSTGLSSCMAVTVVFILISVAMTWPLARHLDSSLENDGDLPIILWYASWFATHLWSAPSRILENPAFHPHPPTLPVGIHTYMVGVLFAPIYLVTQNFIAAWNVLYILTFAANAVCMYLFVFYLTRSRPAAFVAGTVFAFCPFRFGLYGSTTFNTTYWIPLAFLCLTVFADRETTGGKRGLTYLALAFLFFFLMCLNDVVNAVFFSFPLFLYILYCLFFRSRALGAKAVAKVVVAAACLAGLLAPLALRVSHTGTGSEQGVESISRGLDEIQELSADLASYIAAPQANILYGRITRPFLIHTMASNLPGFLAYFLALCAFFGCARGRQLPRLTFSPERGAILFLAVTLIAVVFSLGPEIHILQKRICTGPYLLLYRFVPPLRPLRALGYLAIVVVFCVSVLAGLGSARLFRTATRRGTVRAWFLAACFVLAILAESVTYPPTTTGEPLVRVPREVPPAYRWLMSRPDNEAVIELPMAWEPEEVSGGSFGLDSMYLYWSLFHGRRLVNGCFAWHPPEYQTITDQMKLFPSRETIDILTMLGVRYVIFHGGRKLRFDWQEELVRKHPEAAYDWRKAIDRAKLFPEELELKTRSGNDYIFELVGGEAPPPAAEKHWSFRLPREGWALSSNFSHGLEKAIDGNRDTTWSPGRNQIAGVTLEIDLGADFELSGLSMEIESVNDVPKNPRLEVSGDGRKWTAIDYGEPYLDLVRRLLKNPDDKLFRLALPRVRARYLRFTTTRMDNLHPWSIVELDIYGTREERRRIE